MVSAGMGTYIYMKAAALTRGTWALAQEWALAGTLQYMYVMVGYHFCKRSINVQWSPSITDTTWTKDFVLYSEESFAQG